MEISTTIISLCIALVSVIVAILSFARNKNNDNAEIKTRLTKIETDILYIRESLDKEEKKYYKLRRKIATNQLRKG